MSPKPSSTHPQLAALIQAQAARTACYMVKCRARAYAQQPIGLDAVTPGLSGATPEVLIAVGADLLRMEAEAPRRWFGFGGDAPAFNARAIMLLGRALRRFAAPLDAPPA